MNSTAGSIEDEFSRLGTCFAKGGYALADILSASGDDSIQARSALNRVIAKAGIPAASKRRFSCYQVLALATIQRLRENCLPPEHVESLARFLNISDSQPREFSPPVHGREVTQRQWMSYRYPLSLLWAGPRLLIGHLRQNAASWSITDAVWSPRCDGSAPMLIFDIGVHVSAAASSLKLPYSVASPAWISVLGGKHAQTGHSSLEDRLLSVLRDHSAHTYVVKVDGQRNLVSVDFAERLGRRQSPKSALQEPTTLRVTSVKGSDGLVSHYERDARIYLDRPLLSHAASSESASDRVGPVKGASQTQQGARRHAQNANANNGKPTS